MWRPMALFSPKKWVANFRLTIATVNFLPVSRWSLKSRPAKMGTPMVFK